MQKQKGGKRKQWTKNQSKIKFSKADLGFFKIWPPHRSCGGKAPSLTYSRKIDNLHERTDQYYRYHSGFDISKIFHIPMLTLAE